MKQRHGLQKKKPECPRMNLSFISRKTDEVKNIDKYNGVQQRINSKKRQGLNEKILSGSCEFTMCLTKFLTAVNLKLASLESELRRTSH